MTASNAIFGGLGDIGSIIQGGVGTLVRGAAAAGYAADAGKRQEDLANEVKVFKDTATGLGGHRQDDLEGLSMGYDALTARGQDTWEAEGTRNIGDINDPNRAQEIGGAVGVMMQGYQENMANIQEGYGNAIGDYTANMDKGIGEFKNYVADAVGSYSKSAGEELSNLSANLESAVAKGGMPPMSAFMAHQTASRKSKEVAGDQTRKVSLQAGRELSSLYASKASGLASIHQQFTSLEAGERRLGVQGIAEAFRSDETAARAYSAEVLRTKNELSRERYLTGMQTIQTNLDATWNLHNTITEDSRFIASLFGDVATDIQASAPQWSTFADNTSVRYAGGTPGQQQQQ